MTGLCPPAAAVLILAFTSGPAWCQERPLPGYTVLASPIRILYSSYYVAAEKSLGAKAGVAALAETGKGRYTSYASGNGEYPYYFLGAQALGYPVGDFGHGMQAGAQLTWYKESLPEGAPLIGSASTWMAGILVGYKWVAGFGLTLEAQAGLTRIIADGDRGEPEANLIRTNYGTFLDLLAGWSF